jgi:uncharacterized membrane protein YcaP (DUF421 family)
MYRSRTFERVIQGTPTLLIYKGEVVPANLRKELLNPSELKTILRHQGIHDLSEVEEAVLESDGYVSVTRAGNSHGVRSTAEH